MLTCLLNNIPSICDLLLVPLFLITTHWTIQTIKKIRAPGSKKKSKYLTPCLTSLQGTGDEGTEPERSSEDLNLKYTLSTLDRNIQYIAWQMQRIAGTLSRTAYSSTSNASVETAVSLYTWVHSSAGSQSRTPPTPAPDTLGNDVQPREQKQQLIRPPGAGFQKVRLQALSHRKVDFNIRQKQLEEQQGGPTPHSESLTRLISSAPKWHPATNRTNADMQSRTARVLSYKEQELLNWHIQKKHQEKKVALVTTSALIGNDRTQADGMVHGMTQQSLLDQRPHSHTPPQSIRRHTPPRPPSPGLFARPMIPVPSPSEDLPPPATHICKEESHRNAQGSVEVKVTPKEELTEMLTMLGQRKSPTLRESGIPETLKEKKKDQHHSNAHESVEVGLNSRIPKEELTELFAVFGQSSTLRESGKLETPKEKKKDSHSPGRRPGSPKEDLGRVGRAGSPKDKQGEVKASLRTDQPMHTLSWSNMPEFQKPSLTWEQPATAQPKFLDPSFMCQNQLELPCIAAAREEQNQKSYPIAQLSTRPTARAPKPQCLAHTIIQSLDSEQAMQDLKMHLAKGLEMGSSQPSVEYPLCLLCGRCTPYCPHPRMQHSPCLLVYPRLDVQDGNAYMTLGFLLKIKRSEADMWGLTQGTDVLKKPCDKERPSKREKSKRTTPHRKSQAHAAGPRPQGPKIPDKTPHAVREHLPEIGKRKTRNPVAARQVARVAATTPAPASARTTKTQSQPRSARPPPLSARPSPVSAKRYPPIPQSVHPKTPEKPPSILKQLLSTIKNIWAKVRKEAVKCPEKICPKKGSPSKKSDSPQFDRVSPQPRKEPGALLSLKSSTSEVQKKGAVSKAKQVSPLSTSTQKVSPLKSATPQTSPKAGPPIIKRASFTKQTSPTDRRRPSLSFKEPDSPKVSQKGTGSTKKSTSPGTPRKSPSLLKRTPSKKSTSQIARHPDSD